MVLWLCVWLQDLHESGATLAQILNAGQWRSAAFLGYLNQADVEKARASGLCMRESLAPLCTRMRYWKLHVTLMMRNGSISIPHYLWRPGCACWSVWRCNSYFALLNDGCGSVLLVCRVINGWRDARDPSCVLGFALVCGLGGLMELPIKLTPHFTQVRAFVMACIAGNVRAQTGGHVESVRRFGSRIRTPPRVRGCVKLY